MISIHQLLPTVIRRSDYLHSKCVLLKSLNTWLKVFANEKDLLSLQSEQANITDMANRSKESYQEENAQLKQRIKELEKALAFSKLETEARDLMITRAEEYFDIPIRKKSGAK